MTQQAHQDRAIRLERTYLSFPRRGILLLVAGVAGGILLTWLGTLWDADPGRRLRLGYLVAFSFVLSLSLGSLFFVILQHLTRAGWSVVVRRPAEVFALNLVTVAVLAIPLVWFVQRGELYPWAAIGRASQGSDANSRPPRRIRSELGSDPLPGPSVPHPGIPHTESHDPRASLYVHQQPDELTQSKTGWLNPGFFTLRMVICFAIWLGLAGWYFFHSRRQDETAEGVREARGMEWTAGLSVLAFGLTLTFASFDWLMSLDPHWYSTMFGVYFFSGCAVGGFSLLLLTVLLLERSGSFAGVLSVEHRRDLGRFLFAFVFFWGYIAFSQYMLLWYANVPETTRWFAVRGASQATGYANSWSWLLVALLFGHFLVPFLGILSRHVKGSRPAMLFWTGWLLLMHYLDLYWLVMPELGPDFTFGLLELGTQIAVTSFWLLGASLIATQTALVPVGDPRLQESMQITAMY
jgi:hypothetical protein